MLPLLLSSLALTGVFGSGCPEGYFGVGSSCYKVSETRHDWGTAQEVVKEAFIYPYLLSISTQYCWNRGGHLAEFLSQEAEESLDKLINQDVVYWIGLSDFSHEGSWMWQDSHQAPSYYNWWAGQPDGGGSSNCVLKTWLYDGNGQWFDHDCNVDYADGQGPIHALCQADQ